MVEEGDLFNMEKEIWDGVRNDPLAPTSSKRAPSLTPRVEEPTSTTAPNPPPMSKLEGDVSSEDLALVPRRQPPAPYWFSPLDLDDLVIPSLEDMYRQGAMPMGTMLDLTTLESLQVTISHTQ